MTCSLCSGTIVNSSLDNDCLSILNYVTESIAGYPSNFSDENMNTALSAVSSSCSNMADAQLLTFVRDQSKLLCASIANFGFPVSSVSTLVGVMDMRHCFQCGTCAVMQCLPGQYCPGNQPAKKCAAGHYCPTTTTVLKCPSGYYCPSSTVKPIKCRDIAVGSCPEGSKREVIWIPLLIDVLAVVLAIYITGCEPYSFLRRTQGLEMKYKDDISFCNETIDDRIESVRKKVSIVFKDVFLTTGYTHRLQGVSGTIESNKVTAIIGGSGAGKTSLMNVLLRREEITSGSINFMTDGTTKLPISFIQDHVGYVPQNDVLIRNMTASQLLYHSARSRLPKSKTEAEITNIINDITTRLGIHHALDMQIGTSSRGNGLSMSERKKVNIAFELVSEPEVLFLDEPTTSVDASGAMNIMEVVRELSGSGVTCVCVIHQPRGEIYNLIDNIIVLSSGGHIAYSGPTSLMIPWFEYLGYRLPHEKANRFDFAMDLTTQNSSCSRYDYHSKFGDCSDGIDSENDIKGESCWDTKAVFWEKWIAEGDQFLKNHGYQATIDVKREAADHYEFERKYESRRKGFVGQVVLYAHQAILSRLKHYTVVHDCLNMLIGGIILGIITCGDELFTLPIPSTYRLSCPPGAEAVCSRWQGFAIGPATFLVTMVLGAMSVPGAIRTFGREKDTFAREQAVGANKPAYFLGKFLVDVLCSFFYVFVLLAPMVAIAPWRSPIGLLYCVLMIVHACIMAIGYTLSFLFSNADDAVLCATILVILMNLVGGFVPEIGDGILGTLSYSKYAARAIFTTELYYGYNIRDEDLFNIIAPPSWDGPDLRRDLLNLLIITTVTLALAYALFESQFFLVSWLTKIWS